MSNLKALENSEQLVRIENKQIVTDSRSVAEHFGKRHVDVMRAIDNLLGGMCKIAYTQQTFCKTTYINKQNGQQYPMYLMNRDGFSLLVMGFTGKKALEWKLKYIEAFNAMEEELTNKKTMVIPKDYPSALRALANEYERSQKLLAENKYMFPKAEFYDTVASTESLLSMGEVAKVLDMGIGRNKLYKFLRDKDVLMEDNIPYQRYVDAGYFKLTEKHYMSGDDSIVSTSTYVKQKGVDYIRKLLQKDGYKRVERKQLKEILGKC